MVGALADWFAVTALFRHPLGLPIPHTAIIPNRKDQIGESLGEFVQTNFLTREVLGERLAGAHAGQRLGEWLAEPDNAAPRRWRGRRRAARHAAGDRRPRRQRRRSSGSSTERVRDDPGGPARRPGHRPGDRGRPPRAAARRGAASASAASSTTTGRRSASGSSTRVPWWVPEPIDDRIFDKIFVGVQRFLADVARRPRPRGAHARSTSGSPPSPIACAPTPSCCQARRGAEGRTARPPRGARLARALWGDLKRTTLHATMHPDSELRQRIDASLAAARRAAAHRRRSCRRRSTTGWSAPSATSSTTTTARSPT